MSECLPTVSVILPTRNRASMLKEAIESVRAQTFSNWELIVVDDGSTDGTADVLREAGAQEARIRSVRQERLGVSRARNRGIALARGRYVAFLDDDDLFLRAKLALQVRYLEERPSIGFVYAQAEWVDREGHCMRVNPDVPVHDLRGLFERCAIPLQSVMCRKSALEQTGPFDERLSIGEDYDLWLRMARQARFEFMPVTLVRYRVHGANTCNDTIKVYQQQTIALKKVPVDPSRGITFWLKRKRLAMNHYRIARCCRDQGAFLQAARYFALAVGCYPLIGLTMASPPPHGWRAAWVTVKPYLAVLVCAGRALVSLGRAHGAESL